MRRTVCCIVLFTCMIVFYACGKEKNTGILKESAAGHCAQSAFVNSNSDLAIAPEGYYSMDGLGNDMYLTYISKNSAKQAFLCSKPECAHVDERTGLHGLETCNAYIGCVLPRSIVYYSGSVYVLRYDEETYDVMLVKISADGSVHEDVMVVGQSAENASCYSYVFVDASTILMVYNALDYTGEERTVHLEKIDLNKKEKTTVYMYTDAGASITYLKVLNDHVFFTQVQRQEDNYIYQLMNYDIKENKVDTVLKDSIFSYTLGGNGLLYYFISKDGLYQCDLQTMKSEKIRACDEETMYVNLACDGTYLYMDNLANRLFYNEDSQDKIFVCDLEGKLQSSVLSAFRGMSLELSDENYMLMRSFSDKGPYWAYIKRTDITDLAVTWRAVDK